LITAVGAGFFFGLCYNFLVLAPITLAAAIMCGASAMSTGAVSTLIAIIIPAIGLQGGYMIGLTSRDLFSQFLARVNGAQSNRV
jgi:uncharacterized membrane protein